MSKGVLNGLVLAAVVLLTGAVFFFLGVEYGAALYGSFSEDESIVITIDKEDPQNTNPPPAPGSIPLNSATLSQLMTVPGIGEVYAQRILSYREMYGDFTSLEQLMEIDGIGESRFESWSPYFTLN